MRFFTLLYGWKYLLFIFLILDAGFKEDISFYQYKDKEKLSFKPQNTNLAEPYVS